MENLIFQDSVTGEKFNGRGQQLAARKVIEGETGFGHRSVSTLYRITEPKKDAGGFLLSQKSAEGVKFEKFDGLVHLEAMTKKIIKHDIEGPGNTLRWTLMDVLREAGKNDSGVKAVYKSLLESQANLRRRIWEERKNV